MSGRLVESFGVAATLAAYRAVAVTGAETVGYPGSAAVLPIGITTDTVLDVTQAIPVQMGGVAKLQFNDTCAAGGLVGVNTAGQGVPFTLAATSTAISAPSAYLGVLVGSAVSATGTIALVAIHPGYDRRNA